MKSLRLARRCATWTATFCAALLVSCGGGGSSAPDVVPAPAVQIALTPSQIIAGQAATLTWSSSNATTCLASGDWADAKPPSGSLTVDRGAGGFFTYRIVCCGPGGTASASTVLAVLAPPAPAGGNVMPVTVDRGPTGASFNMPFVSLRVCSPGTATCQTVDQVLVDTGSVGLRILAPALSLAATLPAIANASGQPVAECAQFVSGFTWGSVRRADVQLGAGTAAGIPIQVISDPAALYAAIPGACRSTGFSQGTAAALGANGILGVGMFERDCSTRCTESTGPRLYYGCTPAGCAGTPLPLELQLANPVAFLAGNNNGLSLALPPVPAGGASTLTGTLTFGIGTQPDNQLDGAGIHLTDSRGNFATIYKGNTYSSAFIDSGSNGIFFDDPSLPVCGDFYCPPTPLALSAVNASPDGNTASVDFTVDDINSLTSSVSAFNAGGPFGLSQAFDWGLPFFFGRKVFLAIQGAQTPAGTGPYWAY